MKSYRGQLHNVLHQKLYEHWGNDYDQFMAACVKAADSGEQVQISQFMEPEMIPAAGDLVGLGQYKKAMSAREKMAKKFIMKQAYNHYGEEGLLGVAAPFQKTYKNGFQKSTGVFTSLGYNFYDLRAPVFLLYPVNVPFRNELPRVGRTNDGYGTAAHWKATRNVGSPYAGASEGHRVAVGTPDENDYAATYKELGDERDVSFTAQFAGEGFADNLADEHLRGLHSLFLQEEGMMLMGNGGKNSVANGFQLGTAPTPSMGSASASPITPPNNVSTTFTPTWSTTTNVSCCVVCLTAMGNPTTNQYGYQQAPSVTNGLVPYFTRNNADGSSDVINGGMSAVSGMSAVVSCTTSQGVLAQIPTASLPVKGAFGYAWFVDTTDASAPSLANAKLYAITTTPWVIITGPPTGTQNAASTGLSADNSAQPLDFDGLLTYVASTPGAYYKDLQGATLTSGKDNTVVEVENILLYIFQNYQCGVDEIWGDPLAILCLDKAIRYGGSSATGLQFMYTRDGQNNILGGFVVSAYQSRYVTNNPTGANAIPIRMHPMLPAGTLYFEIKTNPYPHSRMANVREMLVQRDYYSIEWPIVTRQWTFGTYCHEVLRHNMPWIPAVLTGIGSFVAN